VEPLNRTKSTSGGPEAELIDLLLAAAPTTLPEAQKLDSLRAILAPKHGRPTSRLRLGRPAVVFGVLLFLAGASAAARLGARWIARKPSLSTDSAPATIAVPSPAHPASAVMAPAAEAPTVEPTVIAPSRISTQSPLRARAARGENPTALMGAVKALRQDHNPVEASRLLREYLRLYPRGSLSEEARALSFEAAVARHGSDAIALANEYLRLYPHGRFRNAAEQAAHRSEP
jgi:hypothetical protein